MVLPGGRRSDKNTRSPDVDYLVRDERRSPQRVQLQLKQRGQRPFDVQRAGHVAGLRFERVRVAVAVGAPERQRDPREVLPFLAGPELPDL